MKLVSVPEWTDWFLREPLSIWIHQKVCAAKPKWQFQFVHALLHQNFLNILISDSKVQLKIFFFKFILKFQVFDFMRVTWNIICGIELHEKCLSLKLTMTSSESFQIFNWLIPYDWLSISMVQKNSIIRYFIAELKVTIFRKELQLKPSFPTKNLYFFWLPWTNTNWQLFSP